MYVMFRLLKLAQNFCKFYELLKQKLNQIFLLHIFYFYTHLAKLFSDIDKSIFRCLILKPWTLKG